MKLTLILSLLMLAGAAAVAQGGDGRIAVVKAPPTDKENDFYLGNRPPLLPSPLIKLPVGAIKPRGWLRKQLELEADGFTGRLSELSRFLREEDNAWLSPTTSALRYARTEMSCACADGNEAAKNKAPKTGNLTARTTSPFSLSRGAGRARAGG